MRNGTAGLAMASVMFAVGLFYAPAPALADLKICNNTESRVGIALGYKDTKGWASEGWWNVSPKACETLLEGDLIARFYYMHVVDYDKGGKWDGSSMLCTRAKLFTIRGFTDCTQRGYLKTGFFEVDTGEEPDWTVSLSGADGAQGGSGTSTQ